MILHVLYDHLSGQCWYEVHQKTLLTFSRRRARMAAAESPAQGDLFATALLLPGKSRRDPAPFVCDQGLRLTRT